MLELLALVAALLFLGAPIFSLWGLVRSRRLERRLDAIEREVRDLARTHRMPAAAAAPEPPRPPPEPRVAAPVPTATPPAPPLLEPKAPFPPRQEQPSAAPKEGSLELTIGIRWLNVAGIITLLFGVAFFLKYAYENSWIGPRGRVMIGIASGISAVLVGEITRRKGHRIFSQGLMGGGLAALYLSFFFAFQLYHLIEIGPAFVLMAAVTALGVALAVVMDSLAVAILSFLGGYATPILLSTGQDAAGFLFSYLTVLALGALGAAIYRPWRPLTLLSFAGTAILYAGWYGKHYKPERMSVALAGAAVFFMIFLVLPYVHALAKRLTSALEDHLLALANAALWFFFAYRIIYPVSPWALGLVSLGVAACYLGVASHARRRPTGDRNRLDVLLGLSLAFLTMAVPLQLGLHGITMAWAAEGLLVTWLGFRYRHPLTRAGGLVILVLAVGRLMARHLPMHDQPFTFLLNASFGTWCFVTLAILAAAWLYRRRSDAVSAMERPMTSLLATSGSLLLFLALNGETMLYGTLWTISEDRRAGAIVLLWTLFPLALLEIGRRVADRAIVITASCLAALLTLPLLYGAAVMVDRYDGLPGGLLFWCSVAGACSFFAAAAWHRRHEGLAKLPGLDRALASWGGAMLLFVLTVWLHAHFRLMPGSDERMAANRLRALLSVSILWAVYAGILMLLGFMRSSRPFRYGASALFGLTLVKVFLVDVWELSQIYRITSFSALGLILVAASFGYSRFRARVGGTLVVLAVATPVDPAWAAFDPSPWRWIRDIDVSEAPAGSSQPLAWAALDRDALDGSRADLADLRISGPGGREIPWTLSVRQGGVRERVDRARLLNETRDANGSVTVEARFDGRLLRDAIRVETEGTDFRRAVRVEALQDPTGWTTLINQAWIHRMPAALSGPAAMEDVALPPNDFSTLRVTVTPMPGEEAPLRFRDVTGRRHEQLPAEIVLLAVTSFPVTRSSDGRETVMEFDLGYRHARPRLLDLDFDRAAFVRSCVLYGRNETRVSRVTGRTETGDPIVEEVDAPWERWTAGTLRRIPARGAHAAVDETALALSGAPVRYLRLTIQDGDDEPLRVTAVRAEAFAHRIVFPIEARGRYALYYGNPAAAAPAYDVGQLLPDLHVEPPAGAQLGAQLPNPAAGAPRQVPWSERNAWVLWIVMIGGVAILGTLVLRLARKATP